MVLSDELAEVLPIDISPYRQGNCGIPYVHSFTSDVPGPHIVINALTHGNELSGAVVIDLLLRRQIRPCRGRLTLSFANVDAFACFDPEAPANSRYLDEDMNRVWATDVLDGPRDSCELRRARILRPVFATADRLLDLHSMQSHAEPLLLCGSSARGAKLAQEIGLPAWIVADTGHAAGKRLIDSDRFVRPDGDAVAVLVESGQHWRAGTRATAIACAQRFLLATGALDIEQVRAITGSLPNVLATRQVVVTEAVTARSDDFRFVKDFVGMEEITRAGTIIAQDGDRDIRTPYDHCVLIMPSGRLRTGQTAVRLGRLIQ